MKHLLNGETQIQDYSLGTYGKLLRAIWPKIDLSQGPAGLVNQLLSQADPPVTIDELVRQYGRLPALMAEYVARQERIETMLTVLCDELDRARKAAASGDRRDDNDNDADGIKLIGPAGGPGPDSGSANGCAGSAARSGSGPGKGQRGTGRSSGGYRKS